MIRPTSFLRKSDVMKSIEVHPIWVGRFEVSGPRDHELMDGHRAAWVWASARAQNGEELQTRVTLSLQKRGIAVERTDELMIADGEKEFSQEVQKIVGEASRTIDHVVFGRFHGFERRDHRPPPFLELKTERMVLRPWRKNDRVPFAEMNADRDVMQFFPAPMTQRQSDEAMDRYLQDFDNYGFSFLVAELKATKQFVGIIGMQVMHDVIPNVAQPAFEIGWRLKKEFWGKGLATEGGHAITDLAFHHFRFDEVVAICAVENKASRRVMEKLGMTHRADLDFMHPRMPAQHLYARHTLYQLANPYLKG